MMSASIQDSTHFGDFGGFDDKSGMMDIHQVTYIFVSILLQAYTSTYIIVFLGLLLMFAVDLLIPKVSMRSSICPLCSLHFPPLMSVCHMSHCCLK